MKIAIVEDWMIEQKKLKELIENNVVMKNVKMQFTFYASGEEILDDYHKGKYDVIFLDIIMQGISGIEVAQHIRQQDENVPIIFITTEANFALHAYQVHAVDYLVKPIQLEQLTWCLKQVRREVDYNTSTMIVNSIGRGGTTVQNTVAIPDILYAKYNNRILAIYTTNRVFYTSMTLQKFLECLIIPKNFIECTRGIAVNLAYVTKIEVGTLILSNKQTLPVSRRKQKEVKEALIDYTFETMRANA